MAGSEGSIALESLTALHRAAIALATASATVHLVLGIGFLPHRMGVAFLLATAGFLFGIVLAPVDYHRRLVYFAEIPFTGAQIAFRYLVNEPVAVGTLSVSEVVDEVAQGPLIVALVEPSPITTRTRADRAADDAPFNPVRPSRSAPRSARGSRRIRECGTSRNRGTTLARRCPAPC